MVVPRPLLQPLVPRLRRLLPGLAMSSATGSFSLQQPLNYRGGARLQPADGGQVEEVYEPATGGDTRGDTALPRGGAAPTPISSALAAWDWLRPSAKVLGFGSNDFQINCFFLAWLLADPRQGGEGLTEMRNAWQGAGGGSSRRGERRSL